MRRITIILFLALLLGFSALLFGSCKFEIDKAGKAVDESRSKNKWVKLRKKQDKL
jgi:hypothetical protein